jgi:hypothetical protein
MENNYRKLTNSQLASAILKVKGKRIDMQGYLPFKAIYDSSPPVVTLKSSRQTGKSLSIGGMIVTNSILRPHFGSLMISPLAQQTSRFSSTYLDPFLNEPLLKKHFMDSSSKKNVFYKSLANGSYIILAYADSSDSADRVRGASVDLLLLDEVQDISSDALPILKETLTASEYAYTRYCGTAKTENNTLEYQWKLSNQLEWVVRCKSCGKHSVPSDFDSCLRIVTVNPNGPGCLHCGAVINMSEGKWLAARPDIKNHFGFHIPAFCMPVRNRPKKWVEILEKVKNYPTQKLSNEVFGLASGVGGRILSLKEAMNCCNPDRTEWDKGFPTDSRNIVMTTLGVDWSVSGSTKSYTVINILGYDYQGKMYVLYSQRLDGVDILEQVARVEQLYHQYKCSMVGSDRGVGVLQGQMLKQHLGDDKVVMVNYVAAKAALRFDKAGNFYAADRTMNIDTVVVKAKIGRTKLETPSWTLMAEYWQDALNMFEEETLSGRRVYRKDEDLCDDWCHSVVFGNIAAQVIRGEFTFIDETPAVNMSFDLSAYT